MQNKELQLEDKYWAMLLGKLEYDYLNAIYMQEKAFSMLRTHILAFARWSSIPFHKISSLLATAVSLQNELTIQWVSCPTEL